MGLKSMAFFVIEYNGLPFGLHNRKDMADKGSE